MQIRVEKQVWVGTYSKSSGCTRGIWYNNASSRDICVMRYRGAFLGAEDKLVQGRASHRLEAPEAGSHLGTVRDDKRQAAPDYFRSRCGVTRSPSWDLGL